MCLHKNLQGAKVKGYSVVPTLLTRDIHFVSVGDKIYTYRWTRLRILRKVFDYYQKHGRQRNEREPIEGHTQLINHFLNQSGPMNIYLCKSH